MMKTLILSTAFMGLFAITSCKKNRICECKNANTTYKAGEIEATKAQAKKHCKNLSTSTTDCYLK